MKKHLCVVAGFLISAFLLVRAQDVTIVLTGGGIPTLALPDLKGAGDAQQFMALVNRILWEDVGGSGMVKLSPKTMYPTAVPQQPRDLLPDSSPANFGPRTRDWSRPPVSADYLVLGYAAIQNGVFVLNGWMLNLNRESGPTSQVIGRRYFGNADEEGARKAAHEFAADLISMFGGQTIYGTHIYFVSDRTGHKEIWAMDPDGSNQRQITKYNFIAQYPAVSPDGSKIAFTVWPREGAQPRIAVFSTDPVRDLRFYNQESPVNGTPSFTPDGKNIVFISAVGKSHRIFMADLDGRNFRPITNSEFDDAEPEVNPKTGQGLVFSSGRSGREQIYRSNMDGSDIERLTDGTGEAANPSWHPKGQAIAFAWTQGYSSGRFNIFTMDVASRKYMQLTHGEGRNENPSWDPGGAHIAFASNRSGPYQIWTMLADGTQLRQLTSAGNNMNPVWGR